MVGQCFGDFLEKTDFDELHMVAIRYYRCFFLVLGQTLRCVDSFLAPNATKFMWLG